MTTSPSPQQGSQNPFTGPARGNPGPQYRYAHVPQQGARRHAAPQGAPYAAPQGAIPQQWGAPQQQYGTPPPWGPVGADPRGPQPPRKKGGKAKWVIGVIVALIVLSAALGGNGKSTPAADPAAAAPAAQSSAEVPAPAGQGYDGFGKTSGKYGEEIVAGDLAVTAEAPKKISQEFLGAQYCSVVSYRNTGSTKASFNPFDWKFRTADGVETSASIPFNAGKALNSGELAPGGKVSGQICADTTTTNVNGVVYNPGFGIMHEIAWTG